VSVRSLTTLAVQRDKGRPVSPRATREIAADSAGEIRTADGTVAGGDAVASATDILVSSIPTEIVATYTAIVAVISAALVESAAGDYLPLRWWLFGGFCAATAISVATGYHTSKDPASSRRFPWLEIVSASLAFAAWGLAMPESPLFFILENPVLPITVGLIVVITAFVITGFVAPFLQKPASK
jgi:hypothetical protein